MDDRPLDHDRAIQDDGRAIRLNPNYPYGFEQSRMGLLPKRWLSARCQPITLARGN
jgi:hypothetical protein